MGLRCTFDTGDAEVRISLSGVCASTSEIRQLVEFSDNYDSSNMKKTVLDLSKCTFLDSSAVSPILSIYKKAIVSGGIFEVCNASSEITSFLCYIGLDQVIKITPSSAS